MIILWCMVGLWLLWCAGNLALILWFKPVGGPNCTGQRVYVPGRLHGILTEDEFAGVVAHENGHKYHRHTWKNFARVCFFTMASDEDRYRQELEADDYAAACGRGPELASALRKMSTHPLDLRRAARLEV